MVDMIADSKLIRIADSAIVWRSVYLEHDGHKPLTSRRTTCWYPGEKLCAIADRAYPTAIRECWLAWSCFEAWRANAASIAAPGASSNSF
jgi:hypothetical protein